MADQVAAAKLAQRAQNVTTQADRAEAAGAPARDVAVLRQRAAGMSRMAAGAGK